jgi:hypothetical protein
MSSGTTQLVGPGLDDTASAVTNIGFDFWFAGTRAALVLRQCQRPDAAWADSRLDRIHK